MIDVRSDPWSIDESAFHGLRTATDQMEFLVRYALLAPSGHNTQPWIFTISDEEIAVHPDYSRRLPHVDPQDRELLMSLGAAITNLRVAAAHYGYETHVRYPAPANEADPVAIVSLRQGGRIDGALRVLFPSITRRRTNRQPFADEPLTPEALEKICDLADEYDDHIQLLLPRDKEVVARLVTEGDHLQMSDRDWRSELAEWVRVSREDAVDGMPADLFGFPDVLAPAAASIIRRLDLGGMSGRRDEVLVRRTPLLVVITSLDGPRALVQAGEVLERLLLTITSVGLQYSFLNQPIEVSQLRHTFGKVIRSGYPPQLLIRIGAAAAVDRPAPRRPLEEVVR